MGWDRRAVISPRRPASAAPSRDGLAVELRRWPEKPQPLLPPAPLDRPKTADCGAAAGGGGGLFSPHLKGNVLRFDERSLVGLELVACKQGLREAQQAEEAWRQRAHLAERMAKGQATAFGEERAQYHRQCAAEFVEQDARHAKALGELRAQLTEEAKAAQVRLRAELASARTAVARARLQLEEQEQRTSKERQSLQAAAAEVAARLRAEAEGLRGQMAKQARDLAQRAASLDQRDETIDELEMKLAERDTSILSLEASVVREAEAGAARVADRELTIEEQDSTIAQMRAAAEQAVAESAAAMAERDGTIREQGGKVEALTAAAAQAATDAAESARRIGELEAAVAEQGKAMATAMAAAEKAAAESTKLAAEASIQGLHQEVAALKAKAEAEAAASAALIATHERTIAELQGHGRVIVHLSHATKLRAGDGSTSDPYIVFQFGGRTEQSGVIKKTLNPEYKAEFVFGFNSFDAAVAETMGVEAWDHDEVSENDRLGVGALPLAKHRAALERGERVECTVPLEYKPMVGKAVAAGEVFVSLAWEKKN